MAGRLSALRRWALTAVALALTACGARDPRDAFADSRPPPGLAERFHPPEGWAWGLISAGAGAKQRYGVSAPATVARGQVLILPDYGETAETWFETARDLNAAGYVVWVLEGVGQGGSARLRSRRDVGDVNSFDADVAAVRNMAGGVIQPTPQRPLFVMGEGVGAIVAARAAETGLQPAGLVLSAPACQPSLPAGRWRRDGPDDLALGRTHDRWRGAVTHAWQMQNPDLRMGAPDGRWRAAFAALRGDAGAGVGAIRVPGLVLDAAQPSHCLEIPGAARRVVADADTALELEDDRRRAGWLAAIEDFLATLSPRLPERALSNPGRAH